LAARLDLTQHFAWFRLRHLATDYLEMAALPGYRDEVHATSPFEGHMSSMLGHGHLAR